MIVLLIKNFFRFFPSPMIINPRNYASFYNIRNNSVHNYNSCQNVFETLFEINKLSKNYIEQVSQCPVIEENAEEETCTDNYLENGE